MGPMTDLPTQFLSWDGLYNLRDLGGYSTTDGRITRSGILFRSEAFFRLSAESREDLFQSLHLTTIIDLRSQQERQDQGFVETSDGQRLLHLPLLDVSLGSDLDRAQPDYLAKVYRAILISQPHSLREAISTIVNPDNWPLLFHCAAGKDRTGIVAMLTLSLAHVSNDLIAADYALTEHALRGVLASNDPELDPVSWRDLPQSVIGSTPATALATLEFIEENYGSVGDYLVEIGLDRGDLERFKYAFTAPDRPR